jgi:hypothetical protein
MNSVASLRNHLEMFQNIFSDALTADSPFTQQPQHITTPLRAHQLSALYAMRQKELGLRTGYKVPGSDHTLFSQYAFLGDRTGVGKTFMVLGHISQMSLEPLNQIQMSNLHVQSTASCFSIYPQIEPTTLYDSLVVVPHTIYRQWQDTVKKTTLKAVFLKSLRDLDKDNLVTNLEGAHLTLISNTLLPLFMNSMRARNLTPTWRRVFYDEADTIKISSTVEAPAALMTWYVTASYNNLLFTNQYYHSFILRQLPPEFVRNLHVKLQALIQTYTDNHPVVTFFKTQSHGFFMSRIKSQHPLRSSLVIINSDEFLDTSVRLPPLNSQVIRCETPVSQRIVQNAISTEVESMLNAGDIQGVLQSLGISSHISITLVDAVCETKIKEKERLERLLAFKQNETYATPQAKEVAIAALEEKIQRVKVQIDDIKQRIESNDNCAICFDTQDNPLITPCCLKIFCANCILPWMTRNMACPLCRASFHPSEMRAIGENILRGPQAQPRLPKKSEALIKILEDNPEGKFLIFSRYENPLFALYERLSTSYTSATLQGNKDVIAHLLDNFAKGHTKILFLNSRNAAAGINIPAATHVILLHKMAQEEEKQILGRAYRMGRTSPLNFIQLLTERE